MITVTTHQYLAIRHVSPEVIDTIVCDGDSIDVTFQVGQEPTLPEIDAMVVTYDAFKASAQADRDAAEAEEAQVEADAQTIKAFLEAESYDGPSLLICYSHCIAHGIDLANNLRQQDLAVNAGHWGLFRYDPRKVAEGENPLHLDSKEPSMPYRDFAMSETRVDVFERTYPEAAHRFMEAARDGLRAPSIPFSHF